MKQQAGRLLRQAWAGLLDHVYPPCCLLCERYECPLICETCFAAFQPIDEVICPHCGRPVIDNVPCRVCADALAANPQGWGFDAARAAGIYTGPLRHAVHRLKYRNVELLGEPLGAYLANRIVADNLLPSADLKTISAIIPLPLHSSRERSRGFNQSALLAAPVAQMLGVPLLPKAARRVRKAPAQVGLSPEARRKNVAEGMFVAEIAVKGKTVLLIDDVFTTGATVSACSRALKEAGAARVYVVTLAAGG